MTRLETLAPWIIGALMIVTTVFSFNFFQSQSLRLDESQSLWQTSHTPTKILELVAEDVHVPFYHEILHIWQLIFGSNVSLARFLSFIFFLLSIPLMYALGKLCYDARTSLFATTLFSISPFMNWYGNEIRMYSLFVLIVLLNQYFFIRIFKDRRETAWWGFGITAFLGMYTHYFFFLVLLSDALFYFYNKKLFEPFALRRFFNMYLLLAILFVPWVFFVFHLGQIANTTPTLPSPTTVNFFNTLSQFLFGFQTDHLNTFLVSLWPLTVLFVFLALRKNSKVAPETIYLLFCFLLPNVVAFAVSIAWKPIYLTRYLIFTMPSMYFVLSWLVSTYPRFLGNIVRGVLIGVMAITLCIEAVSATTPVKENYREATAYLNENSGPSDIIAISAPYTIYPVLYYYSGPASLATLPIWDMNTFGPIPAFSEAELEKDIETLKKDHDNLWLLLSYDEGYEEKERIYFDTHFERLYSRQFSPGLTLYEYKLRYDH
jgi:mannosyltransferase